MDRLTANTNLEGAMMNQINSIILEGNIVNKPAYNPDYGNGALTMIMSSNRYTMDNGVSKKHTVSISVICYAQLAMNMAEVLTAGRGIRLVGRLAEELGKLVVVAANIVVKPAWNMPGVSQSADPEEEQDTIDEALEEEDYLSYGKPVDSDANDDSKETIKEEAAVCQLDLF